MHPGEAHKIFSTSLSHVRNRGTGVVYIREYRWGFRHTIVVSSALSWIFPHSNGTPQSIPGGKSPAVRQRASAYLFNPTRG